MQLLNQTPFALGHVVVLDRRAAEQLIVVLKGAWSITGEGTLAVAEEQAPPQPADTFHGEPDRSSIRGEAELGPAKPATDCFLLGSVRPPRAGTHTMDVRLRVGSLSKTVRVFGERRWLRSLVGARVSRPQPFAAVPLIWELAYGGRDETTGQEDRPDENPVNPVGRGHRGKRSRAPWVDTPLPQLEDPGQLIGRPGQKVPPAAFAPLCRGWQPRRRFAGTYDQRWIDERMPLLPDDFDPRFHNAAPAGLTAHRHLRGGEPVEVVGAGPRGKLTFTLPRPQPMAFVCVGGHTHDLAMSLDTVAVDIDAMQLRLVWKAELDIHRRLPQLGAIECRLQGAPA
jgi:hypothetical protein